MKKTLQSLNILSFLAVILVNYLSVSGLFNDTTIGEVSDSLNSLFTPAAYAFSIWGLIYLLLFGFVIYQSRSLFKPVKDDDFILKVGWWFILSCIANSLWVICWIYEYTGLSCICIFILLFSLIKIVLKNRMELWDAPITVISFLWWPFVVYSGWVTVASIANVASYLVKIGWDAFGISQITWTIIMILIATIINLIMTWKRNMREFAFVGAWALIAIGIENIHVYPILFYISISAAIFLIISSGYHSYLNRSTNPIKKLQQYRQNH